MTKPEFLALCGEHLIDPQIALESDSIQDALIARDDAEVRRLLREEF